MKNSIKSAFSLVELSIVILIISILISGTLTVSRTSITNARIKETENKLKEINKAIGNFLITNKRLPCPSPIDLAKTDANYGVEPTSSGTTLGTLCNQTLSTKTVDFSSDAETDTVAHGMLPVKALNLDNDMAEDGFESKFSYYVNTSYVLNYNTSSTISFEGSDPDAATNDFLTIKEISNAGTNITDKAVFVIVSHGPNKLGAFAASSTSQNSTTGETTDEGENRYAAAFDEIFVVNSDESDFDDSLLFKTKTQIAIDAGIEFMVCNGDDADSTYSYTPSCATSALTWDDAAYGETPGSSNTCSSVGCVAGGTATRPCGKYGAWGAVTDGCSD